MDKKEREIILREINGGLLELLSVRERIEVGMIKNSMDADKILRLWESLGRRVDLITKKILNDLEIKQGGLR